jgi:hypothetical protein
MTSANLATAAIVALAMASSWPASADQRYTCKGERIAPTGLPTSPIVADLNLGPPLNIAIDGKNLKTRVLNKNSIQLRFQTSEFIGEFFYYTAELILIYDKVGHLAKLPCSLS